MFSDDKSIDRKYGTVAKNYFCNNTSCFLMYILLLNVTLWGTIACLLLISLFNYKLSQKYN